MSRESTRFAIAARSSVRIPSLLCASLLVSPLQAAQIDIAGPAGSSAFGSQVTVLPNGNFVVTDPHALSERGAVYLYSANGSLISTLTGSVAGDHVGGDYYRGPVVVGDSNFVVISSEWNNGAATQAGAATWINGTTGLNGVVSAANSLVGTTNYDEVGSYGIYVLANGNYVIASNYWNNGGDDTEYGAVTWGSGASGVRGPVSAANSLIGTTPYDNVGYYGVVALANGNYVVVVPDWNGNGVSDAAYGAVTWGNGATGIAGAISAGNSLVGTTAGDRVGDNVTALSNGNYVVASSNWNNGTPNSHYGAATWGNGASGIKGAVTASNSLVGTTPGDSVGYSVTALSNGNYVVASSNWNNGVADSHVGAATWGNGASGITGAVTPANSLIGSTAGDQVSNYLPVALTNGNYVVASPNWNGSRGAATWGNGATGLVGVVAAGNSLTGSTMNDRVGFEIAALSNGNYVVVSPYWNNGAATYAGAATWGNGSSGSAGTVSAGNSLVGTTTGDSVSNRGVTALSDGNYVVNSANWNNGAATNAGAVTWGNGAAGSNGAVSTSNSLFGTAVYDEIGEYGTAALANGNFAVESPSWNNGIGSGRFGAATWARRTTIGAVSAKNSLIGTATGDQVSGIFYGPRVFSDGNYVVASPVWNNGAIVDAGAMTLASGRFRLKGPIQAWNSVLGTTAGGGMQMVSDYDPVRHRLVVGRPADNIVSLFTMDQIFAADLEP